MQIGVVCRPVRRNKRCFKSVQMRLISGRSLECGGLHFDETSSTEPTPHGGQNPRSGKQPVAPFSVANSSHEDFTRTRSRATSARDGIQVDLSGFWRQNLYVLGHRQILLGKTNTPQFEGENAPVSEELKVRVIASSIRKGNIIEREDGQLCVVLSAESFHPGKGTPTTQIDMRRLSDGVKVTDRFKTTEQVERAFVEDANFDFLYADTDGYHFMNASTYDQIQVSAEVIGDQAQWLQEGMKVILSIFNSIPVAI